MTNTREVIDYLIDHVIGLSLSDGMTVFSPMSSARYRRSSISINPSCPSQVSSANTALQKLYLSENVHNRLLPALCQS